MSVPLELSSSVKELSPITGSGFDPFLPVRDTPQRDGDSKVNAVVKAEAKSNQGPSKLLSLKVLINNSPFEALIDSACETSCFSEDIAKKAGCSIAASRFKFTLANGTNIQSPGTANCILSFEFDRILSPLVHLKCQIPIIPGVNQFLIGCDLLSSLGLLKENSLMINLNKEHSKITGAEATLDHLMVDTPRKGLVASTSTTLDVSESRIELPKETEEKLLKILNKHKDVFGKPYPDGIKCKPMTIPFYNEGTTCKKAPRNLNPTKLGIANEIFDDLIEDGFAEETSTESKFSSPIVLVIYPDGKKPRLTGRLLRNWRRERFHQAN
ncbi:hypothetical protein GEMRC1_009887 [Eukaryota sp. GEM-RC1]